MLSFKSKVHSGFTKGEKIRATYNVRMYLRFTCSLYYE